MSRRNRRNHNSRCKSINKTYRRRRSFGSSGNVFIFPDISWFLNKTTIAIIAFAFLIVGFFISKTIYESDHPRIIYMSKLSSGEIISSNDKGTILKKISHDKTKKIKVVNIKKTKEKKPPAKPIATSLNKQTKPKTKAKKTVISSKKQKTKTKKTTNEVVYFEEEIFEPKEAITTQDEFEDNDLLIVDSNFLNDFEETPITASPSSLKAIDLSSKLPDVLLAPKTIEKKDITTSKNDFIKKDKGNKDKNIKLALLHSPKSKIKISNEQPWKKHSVKIKINNENNPMIALVIDDMGIDKTRTKKIMNLPSPLTTSFLTYANHLRRQSRVAVKKGLVVMLHVPMEPKGVGYDPGPDFLSTKMSDNILTKKLSKMLKTIPDIVGINNHMGSGFTSNRKKMDVIMNVLKDKGLLFIDSRTTPNTKGGAAARNKKVPYALRHVFIDNVPNVRYVLKQLKKAEKIATRGKFAVVIGHPRDATIQALERWLPTLKRKNINLVPVSKVVEYKMQKGSLH